MIRNILVILFICFFFISKCQTFRNNFIGAYYSKALHYNTNIPSIIVSYQKIYVFRDNTDSSKIFVADSGANPPPSHNVNLYLDSTFKDTVWCSNGSCYYGRFHYLDSISYHKVEYGVPGVWTDFYGKKVSLSGINEMELFNNSVLTYPNPCNNDLFIKNPFGIEITNARIFSIAGKEICLSLTNKEKINVTTLPEGMYFLQLNVSEAILTRKIIVKH